MSQDTRKDSDHWISLKQNRSYAVIEDHSESHSNPRSHLDSAATSRPHSAPKKSANTKKNCDRSIDEKVVSVRMPTGDQSKPVHFTHEEKGQLRSKFKSNMESSNNCVTVGSSSSLAENISKSNLTYDTGSCAVSSMMGSSSSSSSNSSSSSDSPRLSGSCNSIGDCIRISDTAEKSEKLLCLIEDLYFGRQRQLQLEQEQNTTLSKHLFGDYPTYLPPCECLFVLYKPDILEEVKQYYANHNQPDDEAVVNLTKLFSSFQQTFLNPPPIPDISSATGSDGFYTYKDYCCCLSVLLEMMSADLQNILPLLNHSTDKVSIVSVPKFLEDMIRLVKLKGIESSIHKICVDLCQILQDCELTQLKKIQDDD